MLSQDKPNSILLIQLAGLGDMVLSTPAICALRQLYPEARICFLTNSRSADIIKGSAHINEIFVLQGLSSIFTTIRKLRDCNFDMAINLYRLHSFRGAIKMFLLFLAIGAKVWVGRNTDGKGFFYHIKVPEKSTEKKHDLQYKLDIVRLLGGQIKDINLRIYYDKNDEQSVDAILDKKGVLESDILIGINCSTFRPSRNWNAKSYAGLADCIIERLRIKVAFLGVAAERALFVKIKNLMRQKPFDFVGEFSVRQLAAFLKRCKLIVSCDSGTMHIASALGIPLVVVFGPGEYDRYRPFGSEGRIITVRKNIDCAPCFKKTCPSMRCMELITPGEVFRAVKQLVE